MGTKDRLVYGVGINDADYVVQKFKYLGRDVLGKKKQKLIWTCPFYRHWNDMLKRCYSDKYKETNPSYNEVVCCEEWFTFSKFKEWMNEQDWQERHLDKDIIIADNKVYSPATCAFVLPTTNKFIITRGADRGEWSLGVRWDKRVGKFRASCSNPFTKKREDLGYFYTNEEAHGAWRWRKHELAQLVAEAETDHRVIEALKNRYIRKENV